jgi:hypothetical protein
LPFFSADFVIEIWGSATFFFGALFGRRRGPERLGSDSTAGVPGKVDFGEAFGVSGGYSKAGGGLEAGGRSEYVRGHLAETSYDEDIRLAPYRPESGGASPVVASPVDVAEERKYGSYDSGKPSVTESAIGRAM